MLVRMWRKGKSCALLVRMQIGTVTMENSIECHPKIKIELIQWSNSSTFVYLFQGIKSNNLIYVPRVHCSIIHKSKHEKFKYPLLDKWENYSIYTTEYYSTIKKWNSDICDNMNGPRGHYAKWNKSEKGKNCIITLICGILKKKKKNTNP